MKTVRALVHAWLVLDFFGDARRTGGTGSSLTTTIFTQSFLAFVFAALMYPETPPVPFAAANLCLSSLLVATGALSDHDQLNRRRADAALVATSPVRRSIVVLARSGHAAFYVCLITIGMALPPAILLGMLRGSITQTFGYLALACACSGLATGALAVTMRVLDRFFGHARAALLAGTGKAILLGGGVALFALGMQRLQKTADALPIGRLGAELLPPYHAARLLAYPEEMWRLLPFAGGALLLLLLAIATGEWEAARQASTHSDSIPRRLLRRLAGNGPRLGIADFVAVSMWRSAGFRSRVLPLLGLPAGMVFLSLQGSGQPNSFVFLCLLLQMPAIYLPFLIAFLPRADQSDTGWLFEQSPHLTQELVHDAVWRALVTHVLVPVHLLALTLALVFSSSRLDTAAASLFAFALSILVARPMLRTLDCVPFTQNRDADAATDLGSLFTFAMLLGGLGTAFGALLSPWQRWVAALLLLGVTGWQLSQRQTGHTPVRTGAAPNGPPQPEALPRERDPSTEHAPPEASLTRELKAILLLYAACCVVPALYGTGMAP
jgi:hypothetical protein